MAEQASMEAVRGLCAFEGRLAGTDAERRAASWLVERLRTQGRPAEVEPTYVHPQFALVHAVHCGLGFAGSIAAIAAPAVGFALVLAAAVSMYLDLDYRLYLIRGLFFRRASQNVVSMGPRPEAPMRLVLCAHYDTARSGFAFASGRIRLLRRLERLLQLPLGPFRVLFWSLFALLPLLGARMAGLETEAIPLLQVPPTLILLGGAFALVDVELSRPSPGANDNASGVATALALAAELDANPPRHLDVSVLLTGAKECLEEGMRAYLRAHRSDLDPTTTVFLTIDTVGRGFVRFEVGAGWVVAYKLDRRLAELAAAVAEADRAGENRFGAAPLRHGVGGDALPPRARGLRSLGITCREADGTAPGQHAPSEAPEDVDPAAIERARGFTIALIRAFDRDVGRRLGGMVEVES